MKTNFFRSTRNDQNFVFTALKEVHQLLQIIEAAKENHTCLPELIFLDINNDHSYKTVPNERSFAPLWQIFSALLFTG